MRERLPCHRCPRIRRRPPTYRRIHRRSRGIRRISNSSMLDKYPGHCPGHCLQTTTSSETNERVATRKLAKAIGIDEAPGLFTEGFYGYSVLSASLDVSNHHPNLLILAQRFVFASEIAQSLFAFRRGHCPMIFGGPISLALRRSLRLCHTLYPP